MDKYIFKEKIRNNMGTRSTGGGVYGLGLIGAAIYFIGNATGFWMGVLGFLKAIIWPAILVYEVLKVLEV